MSRRFVAIAAGTVLGIALVGVLSWWLFLRSGGSDDNERAGRALARSVLGAVEAASEIGAPTRCARLDSVGDTNVLVLDEESETVVFGVVADARGDSPPTLDNLRRIRAELESERVDLVITAGGMGTTQAEIAATLQTLVEDAPWPLVAIPGDRESLASHRAAVEALGQNVYDGSTVRLIRFGPVTIGTLPGGSDASHLPAGVDGCMHTKADISATLAALTAEANPRRALVSYVPPRQTGRTGSDLAPGGVHVGNIALADALAESKIDVTIHAMVDSPERPANVGKATLAPSGDSVFLASGSADSVPIYPSQISGAALIVHMDASRIDWRRLLYWFDE